LWAARPVFLGVDGAGTGAGRLLQALIYLANPVGIDA